MKYDLSTPESRRAAFDDAIKRLTMKEDLGIDAVIARMRETEEGREILESLGSPAPDSSRYAPGTGRRLNSLQAPPHDISTAASRARCFRDRLDELMAPKPKGAGMSFDQALATMHGTPEDRRLLRAMGDSHYSDENRKAWMEAAEESAAQKSDTSGEAAANGTLTAAQRCLAEFEEREPRRVAFNALIDPLVLPRERGGKGLTLDAALNQIRATCDGAALLKSMGG